MGFFIRDPWGFYSDTGFSKLMDDAFKWAEVFWNCVEVCMYPAPPLYLYTYLLRFETKILLILLNMSCLPSMVFSFDLCCFYLAECFLPFIPEGFIRTVVLQK